jgi:nitrogenase molybdenum-iron protein alpha/beta subunit
MHKPFFSGKRAYIVAGLRRAVGYSELLRELGVSIEFIFTEADETYFSKQSLNKYAIEIKCNEAPIDLYEKVDAARPDFVISTLPELVAPHPYIIRTDEDFAGFSGVERMAKYLIDNYHEKASTYIGVPDS